MNLKLIIIPTTRLTSDPTSDSSDNGSGQMTSLSKVTPPDAEESIRIISSDYQGSATIRVKQKISSESESLSNNTSIDSSQSMSSDTIDYRDDIVMKVREGTNDNETN
jgi:hypothetical protein